MKTIKEEFKDLHMSKTEIAYKLGVSYETVKKWESNNRIPEGPAMKLFLMLKKGELNGTD